MREIDCADRAKKASTFERPSSVYLASNGYRGQMTSKPKPADAPANLFDPVAGDYGAHGRFGRRARGVSRKMFTSRYRDAICYRCGRSCLPGRKAVAAQTRAVTRWE
jgi:hypothetical protein